MDLSNTIEKLDKSLCTGCGACENICPKGAISMKYNSEGFNEPVIDTELCVSCGLCEKVCPALHPKKDNDNDPKVYMVRGDSEILKNSTSGGVFAVLAEYILEKKGYVCGAAYNKEFEVWHKITDNAQGVSEIKKSKYVQSQTGLIFREIKKLLDEDMWVLFSGAPCQVAGLHNFLGRKYDKLYTMDIICHGAPAPLSWKKYLKENIDISKVKYIDFRHKGNHGFKKSYISFEYKDGKKDIQPSSKNPYFFHFRKNLGLRRSCAACQGAVVPRVGDFSAGDFWGAAVYFPEMIESDSGLSVMFMNNEHARELTEYLGTRFKLMQEITVKEAMTGNRSHVTRRMSPNRERFFNMLPDTRFNEAVRKNIGKPFDIAIYGNVLGSNYGGLITYYALYKALINEGYSVVVLKRPIKKENEEEGLHGKRFYEENVILSGDKSWDKFKDFNSLADTFILGSDQIWNYKLFKGRRMTLYLDFVDDSKKKIAYGASYGFDTPTFIEEDISVYPEIYHWMKRIDEIGVREKDAVDICRDYFHIPAKHVMDPVFLLPASEYDALSKKAQRKQEGRFMTIYALTPKKTLNKAFAFTSERLGLPRVNMGPGNAKKWKIKTKKADMPYMKDVQLEEWLYNIQHAEFVITDSYHCVCFSIIFRKNFVLIQEKWAVSRIESLLTKLNLKDRWFGSGDELINNPDILTQDIDYDAVYRILDKEIDESLTWLKNAIKSDKKVSTHTKARVDFKSPSGFMMLRKSKKIKTFFKRLDSRKEKLVIVIGMLGEKAVQTDCIEFFVNLNYQNKYAAIMDFSENVLIEDTEDFSKAYYTVNNTSISAAMESESESKQFRFSEICIEKDGSRNIYECRKEGLYILAYAKESGKVVDFVRIEETGIIEHLIEK